MTTRHQSSLPGTHTTDAYRRAAPSRAGQPPLCHASGVVEAADRTTGVAPVTVATALLLASLLLSGYVLPPAKVLEKWARVGGGLATQKAVEIPIRWGEHEGRLYVDGPGRHGLVVGNAVVGLDQGPARSDELTALWRALDVFTVDPMELVAVLEAAGIDLARAGYARSEQSRDGVAHTVGARGEGEPDYPQLWFGRDPFWPCLVRLPERAGVKIGPRSESGWPTWFEVTGGWRLEITGPPVRSAGVPGWARTPTVIRDRPEAVPEDWRRAFERTDP